MTQRTHSTNGLGSFRSRYDRLRAVNDAQGLSALFDSHLGTFPMDKEALSLYFDFLLDSKRFPDALGILERIEALNPSNLALYVNKGAILKALGRPEDARQAYLVGLSKFPDAEAIHLNLANLLRALGRHAEAILHYEQASKLLFQSPKWLAGYTDSLREDGQLDKALRVLNAEIARYPDAAELHTTQGTIYRSLGKFLEAIQPYERALELTPNSFIALNNVAVVKRDLGHLAESIDLFNKAIALEPNNGDLYYNRGNAYSDLRDFRLAEADYLKAISLKPTSSSWNNLGNVYKEIDKPKAVASYTKAHELAPQTARPLRNRATIFRDLRNYKPSIVDFYSAYQLDSNYEYLLGDLIHTKMLICDWQGYEELMEALVRRLQSGDKVSSPFPVITMVDNPALQLSCARTYGAEKFPSRGAAVAGFPHAKSDSKPTLGFYSADFHNHATMHLLEGVLERLAREGYRTVAYSMGGPVEDPDRERTKGLFSKFVDVHLLSDARVAELSREDGVVVAFDMKGFTQNCRPGVFAERAAPIQVNYLGYPGTTGLPYIDALIADDIVVPQSHESYYSEKVFRLDQCYQPNKPKRVSPRGPQVGSATDWSLPPDAFVFASFNNNYKITPECFAAWINIVKNAQNAVLWIMVDNKDAEENLRREALDRGLPSERLIFAYRVGNERHIQRHRFAHVLLDTWPCAGHTTASDAIWMGLPIVTMAGQSFASRVCMSLLAEMQCERYVAQDIGQYQRLALELCSDTIEYQSYKDKLSPDRVEATLYNVERYAQSFEKTLQELISHFDKSTP